MCSCGLSVAKEYLPDGGRVKVLLGGQLSLVLRTPEVLVGGHRPSWGGRASSCFDPLIEWTPSVGFADVCRIQQPAPKRSCDEVWQGDRGNTQGIRPDTHRVVRRAVGRRRPEDRGAVRRAA